MPVDRRRTPPTACEIVFALGGDGTLLRAAELARPAEAPLLGINLGKVGFLAEAEIDDLDAGRAATWSTGEYTVDERLTLDVPGRVRRRGRRRVLGAQRGERREGRRASRCSRCWSTSTAGRCRGTAATAWSCATPTGSTAYAFSAGGPVVWPEVEALLLVPISAHALFSRPLVTAPTSTIAIDGRPVHDVRGAVLRRPADRSTCRRARRSRCAGASCRCGWSGCTPQPFTDRLVAKFGLPVRRLARRRAEHGSTAADGDPRPARSVARLSQRRRLLSAAVLEELRITGLGVIDDATLPLAPGSPSSPARPARARPWSSPASACSSAAGPTPAGCGPTRAGRSSRAGCGWPAPLADAVPRGSPRPAPSPTTTARCCSAARSPPRAGRGPTSAAGPCRWRVLAEVGEQVVAVHGQSDQLRLLRPAEQRAALDRFAGAGAREAAGDLPRGVRAGGGAVADDLADRRAQRPRARPGGRPAAARPRRDHPGRPAARRGRGAARRGAAAGARRGAAHGRGAGAPGARRRRRGDRRRRRTRPACSAPPGARWRRRPRVDPALGELAARLEEAATLVGDVAAELSAYLDALDADPARLEAVYERRAALRALTRKYAEDVDGVIAWAEHARTRLAELDTSDELLEELDRERQRLAGEVGRAGRRGCPRPGARRPARFAAAVTAELAGLAMPHARVEVAVAPVGRDGAAVDGAESASGRTAPTRSSCGCSPHPGAPSLPLQKGASGGELSRVMLAIEVVFAGAGGPPTLVFDEVDAGVGGQAAVEIGRRLARLARNHQVLVVTHLPQVAAFADRHLVVAKDTGGAVTTQRGAGRGGHRAGPRAGPDARRPARLRPGHRARRGAARGRRPREAVALTCVDARRDQRGRFAPICG